MDVAACVPVDYRWSKSGRRASDIREDVKAHRDRMSVGDDLPSYGKPPLAEVVAGVQFANLPIKAVDIGAFHALVIDEYPNTLDFPPLAPTFETEGSGGAPSWITMGPSVLPRTWFISNDDEHVLQLQSDRFIVNWRMRPGGGDYPRYAALRKRFVSGCDALTRFVHRRGYPHVEPNQCELSYLNRVPLPEGARWSDFNLLLKGIRSGAEGGGAWGEQFDMAQVVLRRRLQSTPDNTIANLHVECGPMQTGPNERAWTLNITVRGQPAASNEQAVLDFFDRAHVQIVRCFTAITTEAMHAEWERKR